MRETRKVRMSLRSRSWPTTYQPVPSRSSAYGFSVRSASFPVDIERYANLIVRCLEIALSSLPSRPGISCE